MEETAAESKTDVLGILSIIAPFVGLSFIGILLGFFGMSKAKRENRPATLSRIGLIVSSVFFVLGVLAVLLIFVSVPALQRNQRNTIRRNDISRISAELEQFYATNKYYPSTLRNLSEGTPRTDVQGQAYMYVPKPDGCTECSSYVLSTNLENGTEYTVQSAGQ